MPDLATVYVDYNEQDADDRLPALVKDATARLAPGETVRTMDSEGNECLARVDSVEDAVVFLGLDWSTWSPSHETEQGHGTRANERTPIHNPRPRTT